jgi:glucose-6-phosphate dehydrogenase assembly protein OpcA
MDQVLIPPAQIETELQRIWDSLQGTNKMRACLFNLIIFTKKEDRVPYLRSIAQKIIERFPSRIIFVELNTSSKEEALETSVSVMTADEGSHEIVCDLINIKASGSYLERVPFVVLPNILPDLPIYLLHGHNPVKDDSLSKQIEQFATRIIFDSETAEDLPSFARTLLNYQKQHQTDIADLNWARIEDWRDLITETFYSTDRLLQLKRARLIHIHYNAEASATLSHTKTQAIYLQGWIASQLNWKLEKHEDSNTFYYDQCTVYLHPSAMRSLAAGRVISVSIETSEEETFILTRHLENPRHVSIEVSTKEVCAVPSHTLFEADEIGHSTVREVTHRGTSQHYLNLLTLLSAVKDPL